MFSEHQSCILWRICSLTPESLWSRGRSSCSTFSLCLCLVYCFVMHPNNWFLYAMFLYVFSHAFYVCVCYAFYFLFLVYIFLVHMFCMCSSYTHFVMLSTYCYAFHFYICSWQSLIYSTEDLCIGSRTFSV